VQFTFTLGNFFSRLSHDSHFLSFELEQMTQKNRKSSIVNLGILVGFVGLSTFGSRSLAMPVVQQSTQAQNSINIERTRQEVQVNKNSANAAESLPLQKGMPYKEARRLLLQQGWQPNLQGDPPNLRSLAVRGLYDLGYVEIEDCSGTGEGPCRFQFINDNGDLLFVVTTPLGNPNLSPNLGPFVRNWWIENKAGTNQLSTSSFNQIKESQSESVSITKEQSVFKIAELSEIVAWRKFIKEQSEGKTRAVLRLQSEMPQTRSGRKYWSVGFYESQATHDHLWQSFLVRLDGKEILVEDIEGKYLALETWRKQENPMARVGSLKAPLAQEKLPFVGTRRFNFLGGSGTGQSITIKADGSTVVELHGTMSSSVLYRGQFSNPIILNDGRGLLLRGNKVQMVSSDGQIVQSCNGKETCEAELY
jgi:hypothetical protein